MDFFVWNCRRGREANEKYRTWPRRIYTTRWKGIQARYMFLRFLFRCTSCTSLRISSIQRDARSSFILPALFYWTKLWNNVRNWSFNAIVKFSIPLTIIFDTIFFWFDGAAKSEYWTIRNAIREAKMHTFPTKKADLVRILNTFRWDKNLKNINHEEIPEKMDFVQR